MPYPILVLDGPDNGGKSTLAKTIAKSINGVVLHSTYRFKGRMMAYHLAQFRKALRLANKQPVIIDRWWPSEIAYGNTYRKGPEPGFDLEFLTALGKAYFVSYTYCCPTGWDTYWSWCKSVWVQEEEMYQPDEGRYNWLWENYRELMIGQYNCYPLNLVQYFDVTRESTREDGNMPFTKYILARLKTQIAILKPEDKERMRRMAHHWRLVGRVPLDELPPIAETPPPVVEAPPPVVVVPPPIQPVLPKPIQGRLF